ncbi:Holliday junction resolvase RuvX [Dinghuibacter silviterrae]|uniref:Putative pre-16S rRNA nuclease n=1 Tax=Dinghuibacter silviterrae TaxID=1539049 RepID=A0A4R8DFW0_9BACT|nr:Holliday junction resolvase RuvX [Dinghuibacter silviterrae]TDW96499.1 putative Holliday junction resolvase [Dinghuibacter silviterrae]
MGRILAIDYGKKRTGLAVTDPLRIIATGLTTVETPQLFTWLKNYMTRETVDLILIGMPTNWDDTDTNATPLVRQAIARLRKEFPHIPLETADERYTSKMATQSMLDSGLKKKERRNKALVDEIAATILLQDYLRAQNG